MLGLFIHSNIKQSFHAISLTVEYNSPQFIPNNQYLSRKKQTHKKRQNEKKIHIKSIHPRVAYTQQPPAVHIAQHKRTNLHLPLKNPHFLMTTMVMTPSLFFKVKEN